MNGWLGECGRMIEGTNRRIKLIMNDSKCGRMDECMHARYNNLVGGGRDLGMYIMKVRC